MMTVLRSISIAFTTYTVIPMPVFEWKEDDMKYSMCAFPLTGIVLAVLSYGAYRLLIFLGSGSLLAAGIMTALPLMYTGGIHMDGFMDTMDALCSYADRPKKLEILGDPHAGAFAVIHAIIYVVLELALWSELIRLNIERYTGNVLFYLVMTGYVMSRILSAISVVCFKKAKDSGMASGLSKTQDVKSRLILTGFLIILILVLIIVTGAYSLCVIAPAGLVFLYYRKMSYSGFGGITGDLAGWFLQMCELSVLFTVVITAMILR